MMLTFVQIKTRPPVTTFVLQIHSTHSVLTLIPEWTLCYGRQLQIQIHMEICIQIQIHTHSTCICWLSFLWTLYYGSLLLIQIHMEIFIQIQVQTHWTHCVLTLIPINTMLCRIIRALKFRYHAYHPVFWVVLSSWFGTHAGFGGDEQWATSTSSVTNRCGNLIIAMISNAMHIILDLYILEMYVAVCLESMLVARRWETSTSSLTTRRCNDLGGNSIIAIISPLPACLAGWRAVRVIIGSIRKEARCWYKFREKYRYKHGYKYG